MTEPSKLNSSFFLTIKEMFSGVLFHKQHVVKFCGGPSQSAYMRISAVRRSSPVSDWLFGKEMKADLRVASLRRKSIKGDSHCHL